MKSRIALISHFLIYHYEPTVYSIIEIDSTKQRQNLNVCVWNVHGLITRRLNKLNHPQFTQLINGHDVCLLSETWTNERCDLHLPGYNYKAIHRTIKKRGTVRDSGGLLLYFKSELKDAVDILHNFEDHFLWIKLNGDKLGWDNNIFVCLCYVIPRSSLRQDLVETHAFYRISDDIANFHVRYGDKFSCLIV